MTPPSRKQSGSAAAAGRNGASNGKAPKGARAARAATAAGGSASLDADRLLEFYRSMLLIRRFEEKVIELFREGELPGFLHVAIGQEAIAVGVSQALQPDDFIGSTHRAHGHILARGTDPMPMMAEMLGKVSGLCQGKGGSMHLADMSHNVVGANGVVGAGAPMMTGVALAQQFGKTGRVAVAYYGDGASNQGNVHEAMNLAQLWKLPVLFVLENNRYAESTPYWQQVPIENLCDRGVAFGMKTIHVEDGNDPLAVYDAALEACEYARSGEGPVYMVCETKRIEGHYVGDAEVYRPKGEAKEWRKGDPLPRFVEFLGQQKIATDRIDAVAAEVEQVMEAAVQHAREAPLPAPEDALRHVYVEDPYPGPVVGL